MATIIKAATNRAHASAPEVRAAAFDLADMSSRAEEYLQAVRREAGKIVQAAHQQAEEIRRAAEHAGRQAAKEAANRVLDEKVAQRMQTILPAVQKAIDQVVDQRAEWFARCEATLVHLATAIAERIVRRQLIAQPDIPGVWIRECLEMSAGAARVTLRLNPRDMEGLGGQVSRLSAEIGRLAPPQVAADEKIEPGGCLVQTEFGSIDMQLATQLARIEEELGGVSR